MKHLFSIVLLLVASLSALAQKEVISEPVLWFFGSISAPVSENVNFGFTGQYRNFADRDKSDHIFLSASLTRKLSNGFAVGAGFTNLNIGTPGAVNDLLIPELRPFQQLQYAVSMDRLRFDWRLMIEERFFRRVANEEFVSGFRFNWRFRNRFRFLFDLGERVDFEAGSEIMINTGKNVELNFFDQHRAVTQFNIDLNGPKLHLGYMHWFFLTGAGIFQHRNTFLVGVSARIGK